MAQYLVALQVRGCA